MKRLSHLLITGVALVSVAAQAYESPTLPACEDARTFNETEKRAFGKKLSFEMNRNLAESQRLQQEIAFIQQRQSIGAIQKAPADALIAGLATALPVLVEASQRMFLLSECVYAIKP